MQLYFINIIVMLVSSFHCAHYVWFNLQPDMTRDEITLSWDAFTFSAIAMVLLLSALYNVIVLIETIINNRKEKPILIEQ